MSVLHPSGPYKSERKFHEAGVRGRFEDNLRIERGRFDTTNPPTILEGTGYTLTFNNVGDVTLNFTPAFSANPTIVSTIDRTVGAGGCFVIQFPNSLTVSSVRLQRYNLAGLEDGYVCFEATGPA